MTTAPIPLDQFAAATRKAYPGKYDHLSDAQIVQGMTTAHPVYKTQLASYAPTQFEQQNSMSGTPNTPQEDYDRQANEFLLGAAGGTGLAETQHPVSDAVKLNDVNNAGMPQTARGAPSSGYKPGQTTDYLGPLGGILNALKQVFSPQQPNESPEDAMERRSHGVGTGVGMTGMGALAEKGPAALDEPMSRAPIQNIMNQGPIKAQFIGRQVEKAAAVQQHVNTAMDALHADGKTLMGNVSSHIDAVKPEGVFDKGDVASTVKDAVSVVKDPNKLPSAVDALTDLAGKAGGKNKAPSLQGAPMDPAMYQKLKAQGALTPEEIQNFEGGSAGDKISFEQLKQMHSDLGSQIASAKGASEAGTKAAYAKVGEMLRKEAETHGMLDQWNEGISKVRLFNNMAKRSPLKDTYTGQNHGQIMKPLISDDTGPQVKPMLAALAPYGIDMDKLNQTVDSYKYGEKMDKLSEPSKMQLMVAAISPKAGLMRTVLPQAMRSGMATDYLYGKGLDTAPTVAPKTVYPSKLSAAQALKGKPTPFEGAK